MRAVRCHPLPLFAAPGAIRWLAVWGCLLVGLAGCAFDDHRRGALCAEDRDCPDGRCLDGLCAPRRDGLAPSDLDPGAADAERLDARRADAERPDALLPDRGPSPDRGPPIDAAVPPDLDPPVDAVPAPDVGTVIPDDDGSAPGCATRPEERCWRVAEDIALSHPDLPDPAPDALAPTLRLGLPEVNRWRDAFLKFDRAPFLAGKRPLNCALILRRAPTGAPEDDLPLEVRAISGAFSAENLALGTPVPRDLPGPGPVGVALKPSLDDTEVVVTAQVLAGLQQPATAGIALRLSLNRAALNGDARLHSAEAAPADPLAQPPRLRCTYAP